MIYEVGMYAKHFKGHDLFEKNIYKIIGIGVSGIDIDDTITYTGDGNLETATNLVVYQNVFQMNKTFAREYEDISSDLSVEKQVEFGQRRKVEPLTPEEVETISSNDFRIKKIGIEVAKRKVLK